MTLQTSCVVDVFDWKRCSNVTAVKLGKRIKEQITKRKWIVDIRVCHIPGKINQTETTWILSLRCRKNLPIQNIKDQILNFSEIHSEGIFFSWGWCPCYVLTCLTVLKARSVYICPTNIILHCSVFFRRSKMASLLRS